jgi:hypothetical protein
MEDGRAWGEEAYLLVTWSRLRGAAPSCDDPPTKAPFKEWARLHPKQNPIP